MRTLKYYLLHPIGHRRRSTSGSVRKLVEDIPYLMMTLIPPRSVLNSVLRKGSHDAGMSGGCEWERFELTVEEYRELVSELLNHRRRGYQSVEVPEWVQTFSDWAIWQQEYQSGIPALEHRRLYQDYERAQQAYVQAQQAGRINQLEALYVQKHAAWSTLAAFLRQYGQSVFG
jgi:hypothetical protein